MAGCAKIPRKWSRGLSLALASSLVWGSIPLFAQDAESQRIYRSAHYLGRGDTGIAIADYEDAIFYNPAGLALGKGIYKRTLLASPHVEFSKATRDLVRRLGAENADAVDTIRENVGHPNHLGFYNFTGLILRRAALGVIASSQVNLLAYKSPDAGGLEVVRADVVQNGGATFSVAESFLNDTLYLGLTGKYLLRGRGEIEANIVDSDEVKEQLNDQENLVGFGSGAGADLGMMLKFGGRLNPSLGLTISDVGDTAVIPQEETGLDLDLQQTVNVGFAIEPSTGFSNLKLLLDYRDVLGRVEPNPRKRVHLGGELSVLEYVGLTGGLNQGYPTAGIYFDTHFFRLDAGSYTQEMGSRVGMRPDTRYYVRVQAGF